MTKQLSIVIVNDSDKPVGNSSRQQSEAKGLRHRIVRIMLEDELGNVLLQRRISTTSYYPSCWVTSLGGHVDKDQEYLQAAYRELEEEIGVKSAVLKEVEYYYKETMYLSRHLNRFSKVYKVKIPRSTNFLLQKSEVADVGWFSPSEFSELITSRADESTESLIEVYNRL